MQAMYEKFDDGIMFWEYLAAGMDRTDETAMETLLQKYIVNAEKVKLEERRMYIKDPHSVPAGTKIEYHNAFALLDANQVEAAIDAVAKQRSKPNSMANSSTKFRHSPTITTEKEDKSPANKSLDPSFQTEQHDI